MGIHGLRKYHGVLQDRDPCRTFQGVLILKKAIIVGGFNSTNSSLELVPLGCQSSKSK